MRGRWCALRLGWCLCPVYANGAVWAVVGRCVPIVVIVQRIAVDIASLEARAAFGVASIHAGGLAVVARGTHRHQQVERRERLASRIDSNLVVDGIGWLHHVSPQAHFAQGLVG